MPAAAILGYGPNCLLSPALALVREGPPPGVPRPAGASGPRLLDQVRAAIRLRHYSRRTEKAYAGWIRRFILFHGKRHPGTMGKAEVSRFLDRKGARDRVTLLPSAAASPLATHLGRVRALHEQDLLENGCNIRTIQSCSATATRARP